MAEIIGLIAISILLDEINGIRPVRNVKRFIDTQAVNGQFVDLKPADAGTAKRKPASGHCTHCQRTDGDCAYGQGI